MNTETLTAQEAGPVPDTAPLMRAEGLVKAFGSLRAVDDVSFDVARGEILGIVGESGSGKSTTGKMCLGLMKPDEGRVEFDGTDLATQSRAQMRRLRARLQVVPQNPQTSLNPRLTIAGSMEFNMRAHDIEAQRRKKLTVELLERVGLTAAHARRYPHEMSGGQLQRVAIARALATSPDLVVCDEAVSALDKSVQAQVLNLIADLQKDLGVAFVFISHDLAVIEHICDNVVVMYHGKLVEHGSAEQIWSAPSHEYTASLLAAIPGKSLFKTA
ncbi:ATP-binding cassette domain-containing protein [Nocardioides humi]|uniref:Glutathione import ATP-binding protein GsiA n=1 Tax=Nocardioides humi TaxID=449461 RepID=A0ABN1ZYR3_9ACTN|nr:ATP-binding cassette domain-containing protein [Nocardioides humi]